MSEGSAYLLRALTQSRSGESRDDEVTRQLERQVTDKENGDGGRELLSGHVEIFHDTLEFRRGQVLSINVVEDV